jgi:hypothetical protein
MVRVPRSRALSIPFVLGSVALALSIGACATGSPDEVAEDAGATLDAGHAPDATTATDAAQLDAGPLDARPESATGTDSAVGDGGSPDSQAEAEASSPPPVYCNTTATHDGGAVGPIPNPAPQIFGAQMAGCPGVVLWNDRATLCGPTCAPCGAAQWVAQRGSIAPAYDYWTNDDLGYGGEFQPGQACLAFPFDGGPDAAVPFECSSSDGDGGPTPMRVCSNDPADPPFTEPQPDPLGNICNWSRCAYGSSATVPDAGPDADPDAAPSFDYFGGCDNNVTAGTLCCCP